MIKDFDFEIIEGILPDDLITELREICIEYKNQTLSVLGERKMYGSGQHWRGIDMASKFPNGKYNRELYSIYTSALLHEIIKRYLSPVYLFNNQIVVKLPHEEFEFPKFDGDWGTCVYPNYDGHSCQCGVLYIKPTAFGS